MSKALPKLARVLSLFTALFCALVISSNSYAADALFNEAKGRDVQLALNVNSNTPANSAFVVVLLTAAEADDTLNNYATLGALLGAAGNTEDTSVTNYSRKIITDTDGLTRSVDNGANNVTIDMPDQVYTSLGGATNGTFVKVIIGYDDDTTSGTDTDIIPLYHFDVPGANNTTNGQNFTLGFSASGLVTQ